MQRRSSILIERGLDRGLGAMLLLSVGLHALVILGLWIAGQLDFTPEKPEAYSVEMVGGLPAGGPAKLPPLKGNAPSKAAAAKPKPKPPPKPAAQEAPKPPEPEPKPPDQLAEAKQLKVPPTKPVEPKPDREPPDVVIPVFTATPVPTPTPSPKPTAKPTPKPTDKPTPTPTPKATATPRPSPTAKPAPPKPSATAKPKPTATTRPKPSAAPTARATARPAASAKPAPTASPKPQAARPGPTPPSIRITGTATPSPRERDTSPSEREEPGRETEPAKPQNEREKQIADALARVRRQVQGGEGPASPGGATGGSTGSPGSTSPGRASGGSGTGQGIGPGGGGAGQLRGAEFLLYYNEMITRIRDQWVWVGGRANLQVTVRFQITDDGSIVGIRILEASGDASYDESVQRALRGVGRLRPPPEKYRRDFSDVEITFRPVDLQGGQ